MYDIRKSDVPETLRPYFGYNFNYGTWKGDTCPSEEAKSFLRKFGNYLRKCFGKDRVSVSKNNYYELSAVISSGNGKFVFVSISDIRYWQDQWATNILYRTMAHEKDWTGGANHYTDIVNLKEDVTRLMKGGE